jgi:hypothetical protein
MKGYFKYLLSKPGKLVYCITALLFCISAFIIGVSQASCNHEKIFIGFLICAIFIVAQLHPILEYRDRNL